MNLAERVIFLDILIQQARGEQRIADWQLAHTSAVVWTAQELSDGAHFVTTIVHRGITIAIGKGVDEADARAQAFTTVFANEAAARAGG